MARFKYKGREAEYHRERAAKKRAEDPERVRENKRRDYLRMKADAVRHEEWKRKRREYMRVYNRDPARRLKGSLRSRLRAAVLRVSGKVKFTEDIIGVDLAQFRRHIEQQFKPGMTWENYGDWHIDHIKPLALASSVEEVVGLFHYTNLQPLWAEENKKKAASYG